jgi:hypothetical protein
LEPALPDFSQDIKDDAERDCKIAERSKALAFRQGFSSLCRFRHQRAGAGAVCGCAGGLEKSTLGTVLDASVAVKYALFGLKPIPDANMLAGNCCT